MRRSRSTPEPREMLSLVQGVYKGDRVPLKSSKANAVKLYGLHGFIPLGLTDAEIYNSIIKKRREFKIRILSVYFYQFSYLALTLSFLPSSLFKYSLVSFATTPDNARSATMFGSAISPLKISAMFHTAATVMYGPMKTAAM